MANLSKGLEALSAGLLRQQQIGGLMYADASSKEAARKAGELKKNEQLYEALLEKAKAESAQSKAYAVEAAKNPIERDEDGTIISGGELWKAAALQKSVENAAWTNVYASRGAKIPKPDPVNWEEHAAIATAGFKGQELKDLVIGLNKEVSSSLHKNAMKTVNKISKVPGLDPASQDLLTKAIVDNLKTRDPASIKTGVLDDTGELFTGRAAAASMLGFLPEMSQDIAELPGSIWGLGKGWWGGQPPKQGYSLGQVPLGYQDWRSLFGIPGAQPGGWLPDRSPGGLIKKGETRDYSPETMKKRDAQYK